MNPSKWTTLLSDAFTGRASHIIINWGFLTICGWWLCWMPFSSGMGGLDMLGQSATVDKEFVTAGVWALHCPPFELFPCRHY
jgi:hypothetical protein